MIGGRLIKVCGLRAADNVRAVAALPGVDLVGFIFHPASPRCVTDVPDVPLPDGVRRVGVFVDVPEEQIAATAHRYGLHLVQLHGHESPDMCRRLTDRGLGVIKAFPATPEAVRNDTARYATSGCRLFLFDTPTAAHGGSGRTFDWHVLQDYVGQTPFLLGGGLGPDALDALSRFTHPRLAG
ncbi:MAG: phosphoribosylanthranilate isomerase, partial [Tannerella sp.]